MLAAGKTADIQVLLGVDPLNIGEHFAVRRKRGPTEVSLGRKEEPQLTAGLHSATGFAETAVYEEESGRRGQQTGNRQHVARCGFFRMRGGRKRGSARVRLHRLR